MKGVGDRVGAQRGRAACLAACVSALLSACGPLPEQPGESTDEIEAGTRDTARPRSDTTDAQADARSDAALDARSDAALDARNDVSRSDARAVEVSLTDARPDVSFPDVSLPDVSFPDVSAPDVSDASAPPSDAGAEPGGSWETVGFGVSYRDTGLADGASVLIVYGGYTSLLESVQSWSLELWRADLRARGVRHVYAVQGPRDSAYTAREIQNSRLAPHLVARTTTATPFIAVAAHSSGSFPAHELFDQLFNRAYDPRRVTDERIVYYNLDGGGLLLNAALVARLRAAYFVFASDPTIGTRSNNAATAEGMGRTYAAQGGSALGLTVRDTGCDRGATWCMHDALVITRPYDPTHYDVLRDYTLFTGERRVQTDYLTQTAARLR